MGQPDPENVQRVLQLPGHVWHAGLRLGSGGQPGLIDFVAPAWMLNRDPDRMQEATSWRLSMQACLLRSDVLRAMGGPQASFLTLQGASLEMGHRYIMRGAVLRHIPSLAPEHAIAASATPPFEDELRFVYYRYGRKWAGWALLRAILSGYISPMRAAKAGREVLSDAPPADPLPYAPDKVNSPADAPQHLTVSVVIPTLDRYPYLRVLLAQLGEQSIMPHEVIVVDQTPVPRRDESLPDDFAHLPLRVIQRDQPGQCSSRNLALQQARGEYVLFLDDDDEISDDLIEAHLRHLQTERADVSCGTVDERGAGGLPPHFAHTRASDVFPTNNALLRRDLLKTSGLFDLAYERGPRADADLGMRLYLGGALMRYTPHISVLHHHAPRGGLRSHGARVVTYASSRQHLTQRHIPAATELYLMLRYYSPRQLREAQWLRAFGTLAGQDSLARRMLKAMVGFLLLPDTWFRIASRRRDALQMLEDYPQIPVLEGE